MKKKLFVFLTTLLLINLFSLSGCVTNSKSNILGKGDVTIPTHTVKAPKEGKILGLILEKGERISKDQPLFAIEDKNLDLQVEKNSTELAKATAELKALEQGKPLSASVMDITTLQNNYQQASQKATKMNQLLAAGAVSRKQAQLAQLELQNASIALQTASSQQQSKPATPEEIAAKKQSIKQLQEKQQELLEQQQKNEALSPCTALVTEKLVLNNALVQLNQPVLKLLAQDTAIISCSRIKNSSTPSLGDKVTVQIDDSNISFPGKVAAVEATTFMVISTEKPESVQAGTKVTILESYSTDTSNR